MSDVLKKIIGIMDFFKYLKNKVLRYKNGFVLDL